MKISIFLVLFLGFILLFREIKLSEHMAQLLKKTRWDMDVAARQRVLESRRQLMHLKQKHTLWNALERTLYYSGLKLRFPGLTAEIWLVGNLVVLTAVMGLAITFWGVGAAILASVIFIATEFLIFRQLRTMNLKAVNEHLMKLLDFLGNYSITAGEVTGVFHQVSRYMEEPIKSVLDACYYEAQTTGDVGMALLSMAEKIEHPKFKELAGNMEISMRYSADFTALVSGSRRSLREYSRSSRERKEILREAILNMMLLFGMSLIVLFTVSYLVQVSVVQLLMGTLPGRVGLALLVLIGVLFAGQLHKAHY